MDGKSKGGWIDAEIKVKDLDYSEWRLREFQEYAFCLKIAKIYYLVFIFNKQKMEKKPTNYYTQTYFIFVSI